jgi:hypothetical protein
MEKVVRVTDAGIQDADRWLRIERSPQGICTLEFYDLALPRSQQMFFSMDFDGYLLDLAVAGCYSRMCMDGSSCSITSSGNDVHIQFRPSDWPFDCEWIVPRSDFVSAVVGLT